MDPTRIVLIDTNTLFRDCLRRALQSPSFAIEGMASIAEFLSLNKGEASLVVIWGPSVGERVLQSDVATLRAAFPDGCSLRLVALVDLTNITMVRRVAGLDVDAVLPQDISVDILQRCLELVLLGQLLFPPVRPPSCLVRRPQPRAEILSFPVRARQNETWIRPGNEYEEVLSGREREILQCLVDGASNKSIARTLQIAETTVKVHVKGLLRKIRALNRTQAAIWALHNPFRIADDDGGSILNPPMRPSAFEVAAPVVTPSRRRPKPALVTLSDPCEAAAERQLEGTSM